MTEAKRRFGALLKMIQEEPVLVTKRGKAMGVMVSPELHKEIVARPPASVRAPSGD